MIENFIIHHIGVACKEIDKSASKYELLGYKKGETVIDPLQRVVVCFLTHATLPMVELLAPQDENSPIIKFLEKNGTGVYHVCYKVDNLAQTILYLKSNKFVVVSTPKYSNAIGNSNVAFLYNLDFGLIELVSEL